VGILAVELFLTKDGEILVNEVAPRPHNSGHQTIEGNVTSQYAQHLRAILGMPLGDTAQVRPAAMINLLGAAGHTGTAHYEGLDEALAISGVYPHLYGKAITKPFRKMGHVTTTADTVEEAIDKAKKVQSIIQIISQ
jgi:5-(carboxyamino)imidazole ribonucleotide synthase